MIVNRRQTLYGAAALGLGTATPSILGAQLFSPEEKGAFLSADTIIIDTRYLDKSATAILPMRNAQQIIDIADQDQSMWQTFRQPLKAGHSFAGLTRWFDFVMARGYLEEQGARLKLEQKLDGAVKTAPSLFVWLMQ